MAVPPEAPVALWEEEIPLEELLPGEELEAVTELPAWLESDEMPSGDEALAWLHLRWAWLVREDTAVRA